MLHKINPRTINNIYTLRHADCESTSFSVKWNVRVQLAKVNCEPVELATKSAASCSCWVYMHCKTEMKTASSQLQPNTRYRWLSQPSPDRGAALAQESGCCDYTSSFTGSGGSGVGSLKYKSVYTSVGGMEGSRGALTDTSSVISMYTSHLWTVCECLAADMFLPSFFFFSVIEPFFAVPSLD